jgi:hypothetical protein
MIDGLFKTLEAILIAGIAISVVIAVLIDWGWV